MSTKIGGIMLTCTMLRIPWLLVYLIIIVVAACIGSNLRSTVMFVSNKNVGALQTQNGITNQTVSFANDLSNNTNVIELTLLKNSTHEDDNESSTISTKTTTAAASTANVFFDCNNSQYSKCTYFYPSEFYQYYFTNHVRNGSNSSSSTKNELSNSNNNITSYNNISKSMGRSESSDEHYQQWRKEIGLENANLPALDSLSWWIKEEEADNDIISNTVQDYMSLPHNVTYIQ